MVRTAGGVIVETLKELGTVQVLLNLKSSSQIRISQYHPVIRADNLRKYISTEGQTSLQKSCLTTFQLEQLGVKQQAEGAPELTTKKYSLLEQAFVSQVMS